MFNLKRNRKNGGRQRRQFGKTQMERASNITIPGMAAQWSQHRKFTVLDTEVRAVASDPVTDTINVYSFQIVDVPYLKLQSGLFEEFKIKDILVVYKPFISEVNASHGSAVASNFVVPDLVFSSNTYPATYVNFQEVGERGNSKVVSTIERWTHRFTPVPAVRGVDTILTDARMNLGPRWINTNQLDTPHNGFVIAIQPSISAGPSPTFGGRIEFYYSVMFRYPRLPPGFTIVLAEPARLFYNGKLQPEEQKEDPKGATGPQTPVALGGACNLS